QVEAKMIEQNLNEELAAINEELNALNEQLFSTNEDLNLSKLELQHSLDLIRESEERFRIMADGSDILIAVGDNTGKAVYFNEAWTRFTGRPQTEILDFGWADLIHPDDKENFLNLYLASFKNQVPFTGEFRILNKAGNYGWLLATDRPRFNTDGTFAGYISSSIDITEQKQDDQRKNDFIGMVSHELKTPLTSLSAYVQILLNRARKYDDEFTKTALEKANRQVGKMNEMINGFLNVSRLESGKIHIDKQDFDLAFLVKEAEEDLESTNETHTVIFAPLERTMIHADREKIAHVISNLISNAFKYSPKNSTIHVACTTKNNSAYFSVKDEGMGISKDDIPMLFDRYFRVKGNNMHGISGFGIGLYLSSEIIKRHDGTIWAESELNRGSKFIFTLPVLPQ
ncbi:MAG: ATP-binding protein, partial [Daejeonella sp.]